jgi:hypothetical protein
MKIGLNLYRAQDSSFHNQSRFRLMRGVRAGSFGLVEVGQKSKLQERMLSTDKA